MLYNFGLLILLYIFWNKTQKFFSTDVEAKNLIIDRIHNLSFIKKINQFLRKNEVITKYNFILTSLLIDINVLYLVYDFLANDNHKPIFILMGGLVARQLCQFINRLPIPNNLIWKDPGVPSLFVSYNVSNDFFFSGHTLISLIAGFEFVNSQYIILKLYGLFFMFYEISFVMVTYSHYFMDIYASIATYIMMNYFYN